MIRTVAPGEYQSPDLGRGPLLVRIALDVWPLFVLEFAAIAIGQAFAAGAARESIAAGRVSIRRALAAGLRGLLRHPLRRITVAIYLDLVLDDSLVLSLSLLRI